MVGAFLMQFMVQGAWGVIPAHINELSPPLVRGFFPGFAYQIGVLIASSIGYIEALLGEHFTYAAAMGGLAAAVFLLGVDRDLGRPGGERRVVREQSRRARLGRLAIGRRLATVGSLPHVRNLRSLSGARGSRRR